MAGAERASGTVVGDGRGILCGIGSHPGTLNKIGAIRRFVVYLGFDRLALAALLKIDYRTQG